MIDSKSTIERLTNGKCSEAQKTIDCMFFSIKDAIQDKTIVPMYCPTTKMLADCLTKALGKIRLAENRS
ncbi:hypothetical protein F441_09789 [Phytophthora nicotianae CJ01A1]|uniref:Uncharacterized protein n=4 Tax=Phytophthora nicotianae TaxID=4792 RepID=W2R8H9_PHYN3|nr:hypothetical protein PPTG_21043 [Phytophthora nicotianae INRA-310]ETN21014.1 hypothetical protein PPTG_21043 [Phytophthora nicotianae INRA-310]ETO74292.1 hypothetical protein F444_09934 [Phytophthora nicotianae P1976]ETP15456.1 hypothetical protein F441_09789 [Phytophthora nicotianae CJ01A1]ETP43530.1 hypothetical protein F442_09743 [Phytophthora nicotianae P10297]